jgi:hypothetical protein
MTTFADAFHKAATSPRVLRNLRIDDVSSVDTGAGRGVRVVLTKRDGGDTVSFAGPVITAIMAIAKAGSGRLPPTKTVGEMMADGTLNADSPGDRQFVERASTTLMRIARAQQAKDPRLTWSRAIAAAAQSDEFLAIAGGKAPIGKVDVRRDGGVRKESSSMSKTLKCPHCGKEDDAEEFAKVSQADAIGKAQGLVFDDIVKGLVGGGMSHREAVAVVGKGGAAGTSGYETEKRLTEAHRQERKMRLGF